MAKRLEHSFEGVEIRCLVIDDEDAPLARAGWLVGNYSCGQRISHGVEGMMDGGSKLGSVPNAREAEEQRRGGATLIFGQCAGTLVLSGTVFLRA